MKFWILTFFLFSALLITGCQFGATPPVAGPNIDNNDNIPDSAPEYAGDDGLNSDTDPISISQPPQASPSDDGNTTGNGNSGEPSPVVAPPLPDAILSSDEGVFNPNQVVLVGVKLANDFNGVPPLVGPVDLSGGVVPATLSLIQVSENGSIEFGVYTDFDTTPGTYIFFASQGNLSLTTPLTIIVE
ncbi:MAG: hypothetical protein ACD_73C00054G0001 [uncultured bacterium]|nr:MAG: hypothetical protein ACD_73C00054G0001 [uncultured bacterium]